MMEEKNLKLILDEGGYIDYRNIFKNLEEEKLELSDSDCFDFEDSELETELPHWIMHKWKKYDMKDWEKQ